MANWDDDDFEVNVQLNPVNDEEEEDQSIVEKRRADEAATAALAARAPAVAAAVQKSRQQQEDEAARKQQELLEKNETSEERKMRLRRLEEESDFSAGDMLDGVGPKKAAATGAWGASSLKFPGGGEGASAAPTSIAAQSLNTIKDHTQFAATTVNRFVKSSSQGVTAFYVELAKKMPAHVSTAECQEIIATLMAVKEAKKKVEAAAATKAQKKAASNEVKKKNRDAEERFGEHFEDPLYEQFGSIEDDYFWGGGMGEGNVMPPPLSSQLLSR